MEQQLLIAKQQAEAEFAKKEKARADAEGVAAKKGGFGEFMAKIIPAVLNIGSKLLMFI